MLKLITPKIILPEITIMKMPEIILDTPKIIILDTPEIILDAPKIIIATESNL